jgi:SAM-dependent methyltransferase
MRVAAEGMASPDRRDPTARFTGLAELYAQARPGYPPEAVDFVLATCHLGSGSVLVDVGCGTGISSRLFASRGLRVIGIDPNADMRARASAEGGPTVEYRDGRAESTGLPPASADAVLAAQAFHWFEPDTALREFHRILRPRGWVVLLWNARDREDPFTRGYAEIVERLPDSKRADAISLEAEELARGGLFHEVGVRRFPNLQILDEDGLVGRALSSSYGPRDPEGRESYAEAMRRLFRTFVRDGHVALRYHTLAYVARREG